MGRHTDTPWQILGSILITSGKDAETVVATVVNDDGEPLIDSLPAIEAIEQSKTNADFIVTACNAYESLQQRNAAFSAALTTAAKTFRRYEEMHLAKPDSIKAERNADLARMCEAALATNGCSDV